MEIKEKVIAAMNKAGKPLRTGEVAELAGIDKKDAEKAIKVLNTEGKIFSPARCLWQAKA
ncbi:MAG: MarR family transcriptional regulator [Bacteroidales bacterium]|nr:MarR family transcriptional regulator [Bacteroidales bacterium]